MERIRAWARAVRRDILALWLAARDPRTPWYAKLTAGLVAAYALSPIDLVPDFIPVLGQLDDLIIVPLGMVLAIRLIPRPLLADLRTDADRMADRPVSRLGTVLVIGLWIAGAAVLLWAFLPVT